MSGLVVEEAKELLQHFLETERENNRHRLLGSISRQPYWRPDSVLLMLPVIFMFGATALVP